MDYFLEPAKKLEIAAQVEVLVIGAGPSGFAAALSAARQGAKTMIIEQFGNVGGVATVGLMSHWVGKVDSKIYSEIMQKSAALNEGEQHNKPTIYIDHEKLKTLLLEMLLEANVDIRLYTFASNVIMENSDLKGVIIESKSGRQAILSKTVIDASGDGDIAARAGAEFFKGREADGKMQPMTLMFQVAGVDKSEAVFLGGFESTYETPKGEIQALAKQYIPFPAGHALLYNSLPHDVVACNMTNSIDVDGTSATDLTKATIICRSQMKKIVSFLREFVPGYEKCYIINSASFIGIRETRHFKGLYTLTEQDIVEAKVFDDWVVRNAFFNFDVHNIEGPGLDKTGVQKKFSQKKGYTIPYRCFVPEKIDNLLLCGRNISGTHLAHSNFRVMPICVGMGEATGIAAALAAKNDITVRNVKAEEIQERLL